VSAIDASLPLTRDIAPTHSSTHDCSSKVVYPSTPALSAFSRSDDSSSASRRFTDVTRKPMRELLPISFVARVTK